MVGNTKELSCINAITLDYLAICGGFVYKSVMQPPRIGKADSSCVVVPVYKSQSSALSIAYDTGQFFLVYIYIPDGDLLYYI